MDLPGLVPDTIAPGVALLLIGASVFTSAVTAAFGVGGGIMMLVLMSLFMPVSALIPFHGLVQFGSNAGRAFHLRRAARPTMMIPFAIGSVLGALAGGSIVTDLPDTPLKIFLAAFIILLTWVKLPPLPAAGSPLIFGVGGAISTALSMFVGATGPLVAALMGKAFETRQAVVANAAIGNTIQHVLKVAAYGVLGFNLAPWLPLAFAMIAAGFAGTIVGARALDRMDEGQFRLWFRIGITVLAAELLRRALF